MRCRLGIWEESIEEKIRSMGKRKRGNYIKKRVIKRIKVKLYLQQAMEARRVVRRRGFHVFLTIDSQMGVRSALRAGRPLPPGRFMVLISVRG
jgi:hypothetical protein